MCFHICFLYYNTIERNILMLNCFIDLYLVSLDFTLNLPLQFYIVYYSIFYISKMYVHTLFFHPNTSHKMVLRAGGYIEVYHISFCILGHRLCSRFRLKM